MITTHELLTLLTLDKDEKLDLRVPKKFKAALEKKAKAAGYKKLAPYLLAALVAGSDVV